MIGSIRHRGLKRLYERGDRSGINPEHLDKVVNILAVLDRAVDVADVDLPGFRPHPLKGQLKGFWAITVRANWRVIFRFNEGAPTDIDLIDYH